MKFDCVDKNIASICLFTRLKLFCIHNAKLEQTSFFLLFSFGKHHYLATFDTLGIRFGTLLINSGSLMYPVNEGKQRQFRHQQDDNFIYGYWSFRLVVIMMIHNFSSLMTR